MSSIYTRVDTREFSRLEKITDPIIHTGKEDITDYVNQMTTEKQDKIIDDLESIMRNTLEDVLVEIKHWFKDEFDFHDDDFRNFPELDQLIYHKDGWTIRSAIIKHLLTYNKWRKKQDFINSLCKIVEQESERLRNTVFDSLNEKTERFEYVTIGGDNCCDNDSHVCEPYYGTFKANTHPDLPPYHWGCHCWAVWHD